jgi:hypothetical protein
MIGRVLLICMLLVAVAPFSLSADTIDFEGFPDSTILTTQYAGITFSNAIILTAGISLDEIDFPPHSGSNVVSDYTGPMSITFATPITDFSGYFTYAEPLTLEAFDTSDDEITSADSAFSANYASSGNPPNEFIELTSATPFSEVTITGDPGGGSFTLDDMSYTSVGTSEVPEPGGPFAAVILAGGVILVSRRRTSRG